MANDIFNLFRPKSSRRRGEDVVFPLKVDLTDLYTGSSKKLRLTRNVVCQKCEGKGGKGVTVCKDCKGNGVRVVIRQIGPGMMQQMRSNCHTCRGSGQVIAEKDRCTSCRGHKTVKEQKTLNVFVEKGMAHQQRIVFSGEADEGLDRTPGDVVVILQQKEHPVFKREGRNLIMKKTITLVEALTGFKFTIEHLDGRKIVVAPDLGKVVKPGDFKVLRDEGMCVYKRPDIRGDLYIEFEIEFPKTINAKSRKSLRKLLAPSPGTGVSSKKSDDDKEELFGDDVIRLEDVDMSVERRKFAAQRKEMRDENEEDEDERHERGPECRTQ